MCKKKFIQYSYGIFFISIFLCSGQVFAKQYVIETNEVDPFWVEEHAQKGLIGEIFFEIIKDIGIDIKIRIIPGKRFYAFRKFDRPFHFKNSLEFEALPANVKKYAVGIPFFAWSTGVFFYKPNQKIDEFKKIQDLNGMRVGVLPATVVDSAKQNSEIKIKWSTIDNVKSLFMMMKLNRLDASINIWEVGKYAINQYFTKKEEDDFDCYLIPRSENALFFTILTDRLDAEKTKKIISDFNKSLNKIIENGTYQSILEKYLGKTNLPVFWKERLDLFRYQHDPMKLKE